MKEREYQGALEETRREYRKLEETRRQLELQLQQTQQDLVELRIQLAGQESRANAAEAQIARLEGLKRDLEFKLCSIFSSLKRLLGFRQEMPQRAASPTAARARSPSPLRGAGSRGDSPTRLGAGEVPPLGAHSPRALSPRGRTAGRSLSSGGADSVLTSTIAAEIDPEAVRLALRQFVQQLVNAERERDDALAANRQLEAKLSEAGQMHERGEVQLSQVHKLLAEVEEQKRQLEARFAAAQSSLLLEEEQLKRNERERHALSDKVHTHTYISVLLMTHK